MTKEHFDSLPEWRMFGQVEETLPGGKVVVRPVLNAVALLVKDFDLIHYTDENGAEWRTGWYAGTQYKIRTR